MIRIKNILVATDFSEPSRAALDYGRALARHFGSSLHVVHVVEDILMSIGMGEYVGEVSHLQREIEEEANQRMRALLNDRDRQDLRAKGLVLNNRSGAQGIVEYAGLNAVDIIVVGTHGRSGLNHLVLGSVAERVVRSAPCPVLTVRRPEREFGTPDVKASAQHQTEPVPERRA